MNSYIVFLLSNLFLAPIPNGNTAACVFDPMGSHMGCIELTIDRPTGTIEKVPGGSDDLVEFMKQYLQFKEEYDQKGIEIEPEDEGIIS